MQDRSAASGLWGMVEALRYTADCNFALTGFEAIICAQPAPDQAHSRGTSHETALRRVTARCAPSRPADPRGQSPAERARAGGYKGCAYGRAHRWRRHEV